MMNLLRRLWAAIVQDWPGPPECFDCRATYCPVIGGTMYDEDPREQSKCSYCEYESNCTREFKKNTTDGDCYSPIYSDFEAHND